MPDRFDDIREYYRRVDEYLDSLPRPRAEPVATEQGAAVAASNPCGACLECCRYSFYLSRYEFEYLEDFLRRTRGASPVTWVTCLVPSDDPRRDEIPESSYRCPLYEDGTGCTGYEARPLACRTLGPMLPYHSKLPAWCVFTQPLVYGTFEALPESETYVRLLRRHYPSPPGYFVARAPEV